MVSVNWRSFLVGCRFAWFRNITSIATNFTRLHCNQHPVILPPSLSRSLVCSLIA